MRSVVQAFSPSTVYMCLHVTPFQPPECRQICKQTCPTHSMIQEINPVLQSNEVKLKFWGCPTFGFDRARLLDRFQDRTAIRENIAGRLEATREGNLQEATRVMFFWII